MDKFCLPRSGNAPLAFEGTLLAEACSHKHQGPAENRYFDLSVYQTAGKTYVAQIIYRTSWQGELDRDFVETFGNPEAVRKYFASFDPCDPSLWRGIPENVHDADRRNSYYRSAILAAYQEAVSELLNSDEFAETVE